MVDLIQHLDVMVFLMNVGAAFLRNFGFGHKIYRESI